MTRLHYLERELRDPARGDSDFGARNLAAARGSFAQPDPLAEKYPHLNPYAFCAADPVNHTDPTGCIVIADAWCQQGILDGLSKHQQSFILFDSSGILDPDLLNKCDEPSPCMEALTCIANSNIEYLFTGVQEVIQKGYRTELGDGSEGVFGLTTMPNEPEEQSPDDKVHIQTSLLLDGRRRAKNIAHEGYGHAYFYDLKQNGKVVDPIHRTEKNGNYEMVTNEDGSTEYIIYFTRTTLNPKLEEQIKKVEQEALINYDNNYKN